MSFRVKEMDFRYSDYGYIISIGNRYFSTKMRSTHVYFKDFGNSFSGSCYAITGNRSPKELRESKYPDIIHVTDWYIKKIKRSDASYLTF